MRKALLASVAVAVLAACDPVVSQQQRDGAQPGAIGLIGLEFTHPSVQKYVGSGASQCRVDIGANLECPRLGVTFFIDGVDRIRGLRMQVHSHPDAYIQRYRGPLPFGIDASDSREQVRAKLGPPSFTDPTTDGFPPRDGLALIFVNYMAGTAAVGRIRDIQVSLPQFAR